MPSFAVDARYRLFCGVKRNTAGLIGCDCVVTVVLRRVLYSTTTVAEPGVMLSGAIALICPELTKEMNASTPFTRTRTLFKRRGAKLFTKDWLQSLKSSPRSVPKIVKNPPGVIALVAEYDALFTIPELWKPGAGKPTVDVNGAELMVCTSAAVSAPEINPEERDPRSRPFAVIVQQEMHQLVRILRFGHCSERRAASA